MEKSSVLRGLQVAQLSHRAFGFVVGLLALARLGLRDNHEAVHLRIARFGGVKRQIDLAILAVLAEEAALGFGKTPITVYSAPSIMKVRSTASPVGKKRIGDVAANHRHVRGALVFLGREVAAGVEIARGKVDTCWREALDD